MYYKTMKAAIFNYDRIYFVLHSEFQSIQEREWQFISVVMTKYK